MLLRSLARAVQTTSPTTVTMAGRTTSGVTTSRGFVTVPSSPARQASKQPDSTGVEARPADPKRQPTPAPCVSSSLSCTADSSGRMLACWAYETCRQNLPITELQQQQQEHDKTLCVVQPPRPKPRPHMSLTLLRSLDKALSASSRHVTHGRLLW